MKTATSNYRLFPPRMTTGSQRLTGSRLLLLVGALLGSGLLGALVIGQGAVILLVLTGLVGSVVMVHRPEVATLAAVFLIYTNLPVIAKKFYGVPYLTAGSVILLLAVPLFDYLVVRRQRLIINRTFGLMVLFLFILVVSTLVSAVDQTVAQEALAIYVSEGLILYFLLVNVIRTGKTLGRVVWVLILAGALISSVTILSEWTGAYENNFGGLVQRNTERGVESEGVQLFKDREHVRTYHRSEGPIGDANRFAQVLIVLFPLAVFGFRHASSPALKFAAVGLGALILGSFLLTYSRGGFLVLVLLCGALLILRMIRLGDLLSVGAVVFLVLLLAAPGYWSRMSGIFTSVSNLSQSGGVETDGAIRGRLTEMLAAWKVFLDHPVVGVGPGQYLPFYSTRYQADPEIAFRNIDEQRRAHTLFFELAAETGIVGLAVFLAIVFSTLRDLWRIRSQTLGRQPAIAGLATAFVLSLTAYLGTAVFLHLAYQRYYWLLLAVAGAAVHIGRQQVSQETDGRIPDGSCR